MLLKVNGLKQLEKKEKREKGKKPLIYDTHDPEEGHDHDHDHDVEMSPWPWSKKTAPNRKNTSHTLTWRDRWDKVKDTVTDQFNPTPDTRACGRICCCKTQVAVICCVGIIVIVVLIALIILWNNKGLFLLF